MKGKEVSESGEMRETPVVNILVKNFSQNNSKGG